MSRIGLREISSDDTTVPPSLPSVAILPVNQGGTGRDLSAETGTLTMNAGTIFVSNLGRSIFEYGDPTATTDHTDLFQDAADEGGLLLVPPGVNYRTTSPVTITKAFAIEGRGSAPGSAYNATVASIDHDFDGTMFDILGVDGSAANGAGFGLRNLLLRQVAGSGTTSKGKAIRFYVTAETHRPTWMRIENCNIEEVTGKDAWEYCFWADGLNAPLTHARDIWMSNCRFQSGPLAAGCVKIIAGANVFLNQMLLNTEMGNLEITGAAPWPENYSSAVYVLGGGGNELILDLCQNVRLMGGGWTDVTFTGNAVANQIMANFITNEPTMAGLHNTASGYINALNQYMIYSGDIIGISNGAERFVTSGPVYALLFIAGTNPANTGTFRLDNGFTMYANTAGGLPRMVLDFTTSDRVRLSGNQQPIQWGVPLVALGPGAAATLGTIGGSGPVSAAQSKWMEVVDSTGETFWVPGWK